MFIVKTREMLQALKRYEAFVSPDDVKKDASLKMLYERNLFFTENPASYAVYYTTDEPVFETDEPVVKYFVLFTIGEQTHVYAFKDYKQFDYCLEAAATEIDIDEKFYLIVSPLYDTIALYNNRGFCCDELTVKQAIAKLSK